MAFFRRGFCNSASGGVLERGVGEGLGRGLGRGWEEGLGEGLGKGWGGFGFLSFRNPV